MLRSSVSTWRVGILLLLFPALLLLPALHLHPAYEHAHGAGGAHRHAAVVHVDFLPLSAHDHGEHHKGHSAPGSPSSQPPSQISFPTLPPRSLVLLPPVLKKVAISLPVEAPVVPSPFLFHVWALRRDHAPPVQACAFPPTSPRSPPHLS